MPEIISTPNALVQTRNGKQFYIYSGKLTVTASEITFLDIDDIGERDIEISICPGCEDNSVTDTLFRVYSNGILVFNDIADHTAQFPLNDEYRFIFPANTSLKVTLKSTGANVEWIISAYGTYLIG